MLVVFIVGTGLCLPWCVGAAVKLYLDSQHRPTLPWSYFLGSIPLLVPLSVWFALPYVALGYGAAKLLDRRFLGLSTLDARIQFFFAGYVGACIGTVQTFVEVFWDFDPLAFLLPLWVYYVPHMLAGLGVGYLLARVLGVLQTSK